MRQDQIRTQIEEGWQSAERGEFADAEQVFDRLDAELDGMERSVRDEPV